MEPTPESLRILVVEDEPSYRILYNKILTNAGHRVATCRAGDEAVDALLYGTFDIILLDHKIPGPTGLNVLQWMSGRRMTVPVIVITGHGSGELELELHKYGVALYLTKMDFDPLTLPAIIARVLDEHRRRTS